jgi:hypothetical protein
MALTGIENFLGKPLGAIFNGGAGIFPKLLQFTPWHVQACPLLRPISSRATCHSLPDPPAAIRKRCAMKREIRIDKIEIDAMISRKTPFPPVSRLIMGYVSGVLKKMMPNRVT